jgi:hypothetical protein
MEIRAIVHHGHIRLPTSMDVPDGTEVRVVVDDDVLARHTVEEKPIEQEGLDEVEVMDDLRWATGRRFPQ